MKIKLWIAILLFSMPAWAQLRHTDLSLAQQTYADIHRSAEELRAQKKQIRDFYMQIVLRQAQMDVAYTLKQQKLSDEEIQKVLESREMATFLSRLEKNPKIQSKVNAHVEAFLTPGAIESQVMKQRDILLKHMQEQQLLAQVELRKSRIFRTQEEVFEPEDNESMIAKVWKHLVDDLYRN